MGPWLAKPNFRVARSPGTVPLRNDDYLLRIPFASRMALLALWAVIKEIQTDRGPTSSTRATGATRGSSPNFLEWRFPEGVSPTAELLDSVGWQIGVGRLSRPDPSAHNRLPEVTRTIYFSPLFRGRRRYSRSPIIRKAA